MTERPGSREGASPKPVSGDVTFPRDVDLSDPVQASRLLALVYDELRALAARQLKRERADVPLQATELVHEAYLRLAGGAEVRLENRAHFIRLAARAMRQVLIDAARRRHANRRGGAWRRITLTTGLAGEPDDAFDVLDLHQALTRLGALDNNLETLVELRFFAGLTLDEAADTLGVSRRKAAKDWAAARLWLRRELRSA